MKLLVLIFIGFNISDALLTQKAVLQEWNNFKLLHKKQFRSLIDENFRKAIFEKNLQRIEDHNERFQRGLETYQMGVNKFSDFTEDELYPYTHGLQQNTVLKAADVREYVNSSILQSSYNFPDYVNWVETGVVTPVKSQGQCGSCWAFSTTGVLEAHYNILHQTNVSLSEQQLVDCDGSSLGCRGGWIDYAYLYIFRNGGLNHDSDYPYETADLRCRYNPAKPKVVITGFAKLASNEEVLKRVVAKRGPVAVGIDANNDFVYYRSGVFYSPSCSRFRRNHAVLVVGYGTENGQDYWLVKNSWGQNWGSGGYIKMARNRNNHCGIISDASYPLL